MKNKKVKDPLVEVINILCKRANKMAHEKGWYEGEPRRPAELMMLMVSEIAEAMEEVRNDNPPIYQRYGDSPIAMKIQPGKPGWSESAKPEGEVIELADAVIRIFDYCGQRNLDLGRAIALKMAYNAKRPHRHGGKKF